MGVSGDFESIVSGRVVNRNPSTLPLTIDLYSLGARPVIIIISIHFVKYIRLMLSIVHVYFDKSLVKGFKRLVNWTILSLFWPPNWPKCHIVPSKSY